MTTVQEDPGSNPARVSTCLLFTETFLKMAQLDRAKSCAFLKFSGQELSEYMVVVSGNSKFTRLDVREQWPLKGCIALCVTLIT